MSDAVTFVSYIQYPSYVGLSYRIKGLSESLQGRGFRCSVICPSDSRNPSPASISGVKIEGLRIPHSFIARGKPLAFRLLGHLVFYAKAIPRVLTRAVRGEVLVFEQVFALPLLLITACFSKGKRLLDDMILLHAFHGGIIRWFARLMDFVTIKLSDAIITASPITLALVKSRFKKKRHLFLPNGCELVDESISSRSIELNSPIRVVLVGALSFDQNRIAVLNAIEAAQIVAARTNCIKIDIIGGPQEEVSKIRMAVGQIPEIVRFLGPVSDKELKSAYANARVGILPFFADTPLLGGARTKALEYFAYGLLVLSGAEGIGGLPGLHSPEHYIQVDDADSLAESLIHVTEQTEEYERIRMSANDFAKSHYSWHKLVDSLLPFLNNAGTCE